MRGGDSSGLRAYNERLIINAIRLAGALSKAEIARETGLSGQAASVIVNALLSEGILVKLGKVRGQVGQPHTPIALNPSGAFSLGIKIGRGSTEVVLIDFLGEVIEARKTSYATPRYETALPLAFAHAQEVLAEMGGAETARLAGVGVAMPSDFHEWSTELGLSAGALDSWRDADVPGELERALGVPVSLYNDATAACAAEMVIGNGIGYRSALYFYLGTFVGGGVVIGGKLYLGEQFNAGAIGSMPMAAVDADGRPRQLIHQASAIQLEQALDAAGFDGRTVISTAAEIPEANVVFRDWCATAVISLARVAIAAASVIDFEAVVIDGLLKPAWRREIVAKMSEAMKNFNRAGISPMQIATGSIGPTARVLGAALLPLHGRFSPDAELIARPAGGAGRVGRKSATRQVV